MLKRFAAYYKPHRKLFIFDMLCATLLASVDLVFPFVTRLFMNDFIPNGNTNAIVNFTILLGFLIVIRFFCNHFMLFWGHIMGARIERDIRSDLFKKFQTLDVSYFDKKQTPEMMSRLVGDLRDISESAHHMPEELFISTIMIVGTFSLLFVINSTLTLIILPVIMLIFGIMFLTRRKLGKVNRKTKEELAVVNATLGNSLGGIRLMKSFANEKKEFDRFDASNQRFYWSWFNFYRYMGLFNSANNFLIDTANIIVLTTGALLVVNADMTLGDMTAFFLYLNFLLQPVRRLLLLMERAQGAAAGFGRFCEIMDMEVAVKNPENPIRLQEVRGDIQFKDISFTYEGETTQVINHFSLDIQAGSKVALVGESGVGKTTLSQLIPRFYDVDAGSIKIDGTDIRDYDLIDLRQAIGHVSQDVYMFYDNVLENIRYGNLDATDEEVYEAAKRANIHDFVMSLDQGYLTQVGERGIKLSGGQKQRIAIARVFLKDPKILILDEATSALDNITENLIQKTLEELSKGKTVITIAHRLSTVKNADEIIVLGEIGIRERGTHDELMALSGYYASLHHV